MGLNKRLLIFVIISVLLPILIAAAARRSYVDNYYQGHSLYNISNITIMDNFYTSGMHIYDQYIWNATEINSTIFKQGGNLVIDEASLDNATIIRTHNTSWITDTITGTYVDTSELDNVTIIRTHNTSWITDTITGTYIDTSELDNVTIIRTHNTTWITDTITGTYIDTSELDNVTIIRTHNTTWILISIAGSHLTVENFTVTGHSDVQTLNATEMFEGPYEVATLEDIIRGNVTVSSIISVKNVGGKTADKGAAMTFSAYNAGADRFDVVFANNTVSHGHAHCLMLQSTADNGNGQCVVSGVIEQMDTDALTEGDDIYLNASPGTLIDTKPSTADCIQKIGLTLRSHSTQGSIYIHGAGRCNDVPYNIETSGNASVDWLFGKLPWVNVTDYPSACVADTYVTAINDTITCTGISDVYLSNTGDTSAYEYNFSKVNASELRGNIVYQGINLVIDFRDLDNATVIRSYNTSWVTNAITVTYVDTSELDNATVVRTHNTTWITDTIAVTYVDTIELDNNSIVRIHNSSWLISILNPILDNGTFIRDYNNSWVTDNQINPTNSSYDLSEIPVTKNYTMPHNFTQASGFYKCYDEACVSSVHYNGSMLIIKVN